MALSQIVTPARRYPPNAAVCLCLRLRSFTSWRPCMMRKETMASNSARNPYATRPPLRPKLFGSGRLLRRLFLSGESKALVSIRESGFYCLCGYLRLQARAWRASVGEEAAGMAVVLLIGFSEDVPRCCVSGLWLCRDAIALH